MTPRRQYPDPGILKEGATPREREAHRKAKELFDTEGFQPLETATPLVDSTDRRLIELRREHAKFMETTSPMKLSIWLALLRKSSDVLHDAEMMRRFRLSQSGAVTGEYTLPETPAIIELGNQLVAAALGGDTAAIEKIAERIEGKAGLRPGDVGEDDPAKRRQTQDIVERVTRIMTRGRLEPEKKIIDVVPEPVDTAAEKA